VFLINQRLRLGSARFGRAHGWAQAPPSGSARTYLRAGASAGRAGLATARQGHGKAGAAGGGGRELGALAPDPFLQRAPRRVGPPRRGLGGARMPPRGGFANSLLFDKSNFRFFLFVFLTPS